MEKVYAFIIYCKRRYDLKSEDFTPYALSFLQLPIGSGKTDELSDRTSEKLLVTEFENLIKPLTKEVTKIKSSFYTYIKRNTMMKPNLNLSMPYITEYHSIKTGCSWFPSLVYYFTNCSETKRSQ